MRTILLVGILLATLPVEARAQSPDSERTIPDLPDVDPALLRIVIDDQWDRGVDMFGGRQVAAPDSLDWSAVAERDAQRRARVRELLAEGRVRSNRELQFAALVFQHSTDARDVGLAHVLAVTAVMKGHGAARWLAAATMDRQLWLLGRPQIFGTQFKPSQGDAAGWTMEPYDREAIADTIRADWCVVSLAQQERLLSAMQRGEPGGPTNIGDCR